MDRRELRRHHDPAERLLIAPDDEHPAVRPGDVVHPLVAGDLAGHTHLGVVLVGVVGELHRLDLVAGLRPGAPNDDQSLHCVPQSEHTRIADVDRRDRCPGRGVIDSFAPIGFG